MDWAAAERRSSDTIEGRAFQAMVRLVEARRTSPSLRSDGSVTVLGVASDSVLAYVRRHPRSEPLLALVNFNDEVTWVDDEVLARAGVHQPVHVHSTVGAMDRQDGGILLPAWGFVWVRQAV